MRELKELGNENQLWFYDYKLQVLRLKVGGKVISSKYGRDIPSSRTS